MKNKIPDIEIWSSALCMYFYGFFLLETLRAIRNKGASNTTLKNLICTILQGRMHYNIFERKQMWDSDRLLFNAV